MPSSVSSSVAPEGSPRRRANSAAQRKGGSLVTDPAIGQDRVYDGAYDMYSIASRCRPRGGKYAEPQAYSAAFRSKVPTTSQQTASREQRLVPILGAGGGPSKYDPWGSKGQPYLASSISWASRGRAGPIGCAIDAKRNSPVFTSTVPRTHFTSTPPPARGALSLKDDCFVLKSDYRNSAAKRLEFQERLQSRIEYGTVPLSRVETSPYF